MTEPTKRQKHGGRTAGTPNKATVEFRQTVTALLSDNSANVALWLQMVAEGVPPVLDAEGKVLTKGVAPDPAKALDLLGSLAEYATPKLARTEVSGPNGGPIEITSKEQRDAAVQAAQRADH